MNLRELQNKVGAWAEKQFGANHTEHIKEGNMESLAPLMGIVEEVGELHHAMLKRYQGIRGFDSDEYFVEMRNDAVADIMIYLMDFAYREGIDLQSVLEETVEAVTQRDWKNNPGGPDEQCYNNSEQH